MQRLAHCCQRSRRSCPGPSLSSHVALTLQSGMGQALLPFCFSRSHDAVYPPSHARTIVRQGHKASRPTRSRFLERDRFGRRGAWWGVTYQLSQGSRAEPLAHMRCVRRCYTRTPPIPHQPRISLDEPFSFFVVRSWPTRRWTALPRRRLGPVRLTSHRSSRRVAPPPARRIAADRRRASLGRSHAPKGTPKRDERRGESSRQRCGIGERFDGRPRTVSSTRKLRAEGGPVRLVLVGLFPFLPFRNATGRPNRLPTPREQGVRMWSAIEGTRGRGQALGVERAKKT